MSGSCRDLYLSLRAPGLGVYHDQFSGLALLFPGFILKNTKSPGKTIKTWTYWCELMDQIIILQMERTWSSCRRRHTGQVRGTRTRGYWHKKCHLLSDQALRREEVLPSLNWHAQAKISSWTLVFQKGNLAIFSRSWQWQAKLAVLDRLLIKEAII